MLKRFYKKLCDWQKLKLYKVDIYKFIIIYLKYNN